MALAFFIRELDFFLDRLVDNLWQVFVGGTCSTGHRLYLSTSPAVSNCMGSNLAITRAFDTFCRCDRHVPVPAICRPRATMDGDPREDYQRIVKITVEEFMELGRVLPVADRHDRIYLSGPGDRDSRTAAGSCQTACGKATEAERPLLARIFHACGVQPARLSLRYSDLAIIALLRSSAAVRTPVLGGALQV